MDAVRKERFKFAVLLAALFFVSAPIGWAIHTRLGAEAMITGFLHASPPDSAEALLFFVVSLNAKPLLIAALLYAACGGPLFRPLAGALIAFRGMAYGWCAAVASLFSGAVFAYKASLTVYLLETVLILFLIFALCVLTDKKRLIAFLALSGAYFLLHTLSALLLFGT